MTARDEVLARVRHATPAGDPPRIQRAYRQHSSVADVALFAERLRDYKAIVVQCDLAGYQSTLASQLEASAIDKVVCSHDLERHWWPTDCRTIPDNSTLTPNALNAPGMAAITLCTVGIAETGTLILDGSKGQGRRVLTLIPDHHLCIVPTGSIRSTVPDAIRLLDPIRPLTWISGASATSDIELQRVEGVHGPRRLVVLIVGDEQ